MSGFTKTLIVDPPGGSAAYHTIKAAVDDLNGNSGVVIVEEGEYTIDNDGDQTTIDVDDNTTIIGRGNVVINVTGTDNDRVPVFQNSNYGTGTNNSIVISGFKININLPEDEEHVNWYNQAVVDMKGVTDSIFEKLYITCVSPGGCDDNAKGIYLEHCERNVIQHCTIHDFGKEISENYTYYGYGIKLYDSCVDNIIRGNYVSKCICNIFAQDADRTIITNNILLEAQMTMTNPPNENIQGHDGIQIKESEYCSVVGNQIKSNVEHGIYLSESSFCAVKGNIFSCNGGAGIKLNTDGTCRYNSVTGNICHDNGQGNISEGKDGILLTGQNGGSSNYNSIFGNVCSENLRDGIFETNGEGDYNCIVGNVCDNNGSIDIDTHGAHTVVSENVT